MTTKKKKQQLPPAVVTVENKVVQRLQLVVEVHNPASEQEDTWEVMTATAEDIEYQGLDMEYGETAAECSAGNMFVLSTPNGGTSAVHRRCLLAFAQAVIENLTPPRA